MSCRRTLSLTEATTGEGSLDDAVYVASVDKIFATMGPHIVKLNATTGAREAFARVAGPAFGTCRLCYHSTTSTLYVSIWGFPSRQWTDPPMDWSIRGL